MRGFCAFSLISSGSICYAENIDSVLSPKNKGEFKTLLRNAQREATRVNIPEIRRQYAAKNSRKRKNSKITILPISVDLLPDHSGLDWRRELLGPTRGATWEKYLDIYTFPMEFMDGYCKGEEMRWMREFGYRVRERHYANGHLILDYMVDATSCRKFNDIVSEIDKKHKTQ
jgi:hypothetical protein